MSYIFPFAPEMLQYIWVCEKYVIIVATCRSTAKCWTISMFFLAINVHIIKGYAWNAKETPGVHLENNFTTLSHNYKVFNMMIELMPTFIPHSCWYNSPECYSLTRWKSLYSEQDYKISFISYYSSLNVYYQVELLLKGHHVYPQEYTFII